MFNDSCQTDYLKIYPTDFAKLSGLVELRLKMINLKLVFRYIKRRCHGNQFLLALSTKMSFDDIRQMAVAYGRRSAYWSLDAG